MYFSDSLLQPRERSVDEHRKSLCFHVCQRSESGSESVWQFELLPSYAAEKEIVSNSPCYMSFRNYVKQIKFQKEERFMLVFLVLPLIISNVIWCCSALESRKNILFTVRQLPSGHIRWISDLLIIQPRRWPYLSWSSISLVEPRSRKRRKPLQCLSHFVHLTLWEYLKWRSVISIYYTNALWWRSASAFAVCSAAKEQIMIHQNVIFFFLFCAQRLCSLSPVIQFYTHHHQPETHHL